MEFTKGFITGALSGAVFVVCLLLILTVSDSDDYGKVCHLHYQGNFHVK